MQAGHAPVRVFARREGQRGQDDRIERGPIRRRPAVDDEAPPLRQRPRQGQIVVGVLQAAERRHDDRPTHHQPHHDHAKRPRRNQEAESPRTAISPGLRDRTRGGRHPVPGRARTSRAGPPPARSSPAPRKTFTAGHRDHAGLHPRAGASDQRDGSARATLVVSPNFASAPSRKSTNFGAEAKPLVARTLSSGPRAT